MQSISGTRHCVLFLRLIQGIIRFKEKGLDGSQRRAGQRQRALWERKPACKGQGVALYCNKIHIRQAKAFWAFAEIVGNDSRG